MCVNFGHQAEMLDQGWPEPYSPMQLMAPPHPMYPLSHRDIYANKVVANPDLDDETAAKLKAIQEGEMRAELKSIDRKVTKQGQPYYAETVNEEIPEQVNWWTNYALCLVREMNGSVVGRVSLQINSQHLKDILKATIKKFPGVSFRTKEITIEKPYHVLFHYRKELAAAGKDLEEGTVAADHLKLLLNFIGQEFGETIEESENLKEQGMMSYSHLWTLFRPGDIIYAPVQGQPRAFTLRNYSYDCSSLVPKLMLNLKFVDFDGDAMGSRRFSCSIDTFSGSKRMIDLPAYPLAWYKDPERVKIQLIERGRRWEGHAGMHFRNYNGIAYEATPSDFTPWTVNRFNINGRVVVDTKTFHRFEAKCSFVVDPFKTKEPPAKQQDEDDDIDLVDMESLDLISSNKTKFDPLTDDQCLLATPMVRGFAFAEKRWLEFCVDKLSSPEWSPDCFDQLVLPTAQKDLVRALVSTHVQQRLGFDDIVKGKGKGLIMVLHGPPGVGKTLTAETVAEYCKRPLMMVSSGDLGTDSATLDGRLSRILDMASTWKAVLLIDEADVFLERRSLHDMDRNSMVSIFLRVLEYYEGILFLTSNRVSTFDDAFKSRIHVPLKYEDLNFQSRKKIWKNFLGKMNEDAHIDDAGYDILAKADINGRQIKNVIRTAKSLAQYHGETLDEEKLMQVVRIQQEFENELSLSNGGDSADGIMVNGH